MPEGFFDDNARPPLAALVHASRAEVMNNFRILAGGSRKIKNAIPTGTTLLIERVQQRIESLIPFYVVKVGLHVMNTRRKALPNLRIDRLQARVVIDRFKCLFSELLVAVGTPCESYDREPCWER